MAHAEIANELRLTPGTVTVRVSSLLRPSSARIRAESAPLSHCGGDATTEPAEPVAVASAEIVATSTGVVEEGEDD